MDNLNKAHEQGVVRGLKEVSGVMPRLDIDVLILEQPDTFNLLLITLLELKNEEIPWSIPVEYKLDHNDKMSFFQLAGMKFSASHYFILTEQGSMVYQVPHGTTKLGIAKLSLVRSQQMFRLGTALTHSRSSACGIALILHCLRYSNGYFTFRLLLKRF